MHVRPRPEDEINRRDFLSIMAASMAMAGLTGCAAAPPEKIVPYVRSPEDLLPGKPQFFSTAMPMAGYGMGLIVESHEGRPIKIEGNPDHPASLGATDVFAQASLLTLYDPDRSQTVTHAGDISTWDAFITNLQDQLSHYDTNGGNGLRILTGTVTSLALADLLQRILQKYPAAQWHQFEPVNRDNARAGAQLAFGKYVDVQYQFKNADVIVSLDSDFLMWPAGKLVYAREFGRRRKMKPGEGTMNRLYVFESSPTITGAKADHHFRTRSSDISEIARSLAQGPEKGSPAATVLADLKRHPGRSLVIAGIEQSPEVHAFVHLINEQLGNVGKTLVYTDPVEVRPVEQTASLKRLADDMAAGHVSTLVMLSGNPAFTAPADFEFSKRLANVPLRIHQSLYFDETAQLCHWHIPETHYLESWGDVRAYDGTVSIIQPLLIPLYQSRTGYELLSAILGDPSRSNYDLVREYWQKHRPGPDFETFWNRSLRQGVVEDTQSAPIAVTARTTITQVAPVSETLEVVFRPDPTVYDGQWANNAWLQELPKPITKLTWDNAALVSPATAAKFGLKTGDIVDLHVGDLRLSPAVFVLPGVADQSVTIHLGYGRYRSGKVGTGHGFNAYAIRSAAGMGFARDVRLVRNGASYDLVTTQQHHDLYDRHMARFTTADEYSKDSAIIRDESEAPPTDETLYAPHPSLDYAWAMTVDLSSCIGCNACVTACQAENNIPVVGKDQVDRGREMQWIRIDTYRSGDADNPNTHFEPMMCQHCENAPCELVCPVEATSHSAEGINEMTYNRCVGTRYCSNNCPYKVRRFNFYQYAEWDIPQFKLMYNPDVTVRSRGVMEKCTYCIQRINRTRIEAQLNDRKIREGEVVTACQQVCPAEAIFFGNLLDPESTVTRSKEEPRHYRVLAELNTRPRTTYLAELRNPNPEMRT
jgi:Fe-S-cluster-containing dehydrogenase component